SKGALDNTGLVQIDEGEWVEGGSSVWGPLKGRARAPWRDRLKVHLFTDVDMKTDRIVVRAASALRDLVDSDLPAGHRNVGRIDKSDEVGWCRSVANATKAWLWVHPTRDAPAAYERTVSAPERGWMHGEDKHGFLASRWQRPVADSLAVFLCSRDLRGGRVL